jgi:hypothetical protein
MMRRNSALFIPAVFVILLFHPISSSLKAQPKSGTWYCIEARHDGQLIPAFEARITFLDTGFFEARFDRATDYGRSKSLYHFSATGDTLFSDLPTEIPRTYGGQSQTVNGHLVYDYSLYCPQELWEAGGQTALGWGLPAGALKCCILTSMAGDSILYLKSWDQRQSLTYTYGAKRPPHNMVTFKVIMNIQQQLGNFDPLNGDKVLVNYWQGGETHQLALVQSAVPDIWEGTVDFPPTLIDSSLTYWYSIFQSATTLWTNEKPVRAFVLQAGEQVVGSEYFNRRARKDEIEQLPVATGDAIQTNPAVAYDPFRNRYLTVWDEDDGSTGQDLFGQFSDKNGLIGLPFKIVRESSFRRVFAAVEFMTASKEYMVVWMDSRDGGWNIYGIRLNDEGVVMASPRSLADGSFIICNHDSLQHHPRLSYNNSDGSLLCVWEDYRNAVKNQYGIEENVDVYGQRLTNQGDLLPPGDPTDSKSNYAIASGGGADEFYPDVAYLGSRFIKIDEWLVVYSRRPLGTYGAVEIWGVRIDGEYGIRLDTWGQGIASRSLMKTGAAGGPPWFPEFPIGIGLGSSSYVYRGSPHVESNDLTSGLSLLKTQGSSYPIPEFLVAWTEYGSSSSGDIMCQRLAYFPDSTAFRLGLKPAPESDTLTTAALLDREGNLPAEPLVWKTWPDIPVCTDPFEQSWNNVSYDEKAGAFLVLWNDWRNAKWDGSYNPEAGWTVPPADIYGQRLWIDPADSSLAYLDEFSNKAEYPGVNTAIVYSEADEGCQTYPAVVFGYHDRDYFIAYPWKFGDTGTDVHGCYYNDALPPTSQIDQNPAGSLSTYALLQNYPNPFNPSTRIGYEILNQTHVTLEIFNSLGQKVATLCERMQPSGKYEVTWNGADLQGRALPSGIYWYRLRAEGTTQLKKMVLMK